MKLRAMHSHCCIMAYTSYVRRRMSQSDNFVLMLDIGGSGIRSLCFVDPRAAFSRMALLALLRMISE